MRAISLVITIAVVVTLASCDAYQQGYDQAHEKAVAEEKAQDAKAAPGTSVAASTPADPASPAN